MANQLSELNPANDHVKKFVPMIGAFDAEVRFWMGRPQPVVSHGKMLNSWDLGGTFMMQHYEGSSDSAAFPAFAGRGYFGYNLSDNRFEGFWIDTASTMMQCEQGSVDSAGRIWEMRSEFTHPQSRQKMKKRSIITVLDHNQHTLDAFMQIGDAAEFQAMHIDFRRAEAESKQGESD